MRDSVGELVEQSISCTDKCRFMNCKWRELMEFQTYLICLKPKTLHMFVESTKCIRNLTLIHKSELTIAVPNCRRLKLSQAIQEARERTRSHSALSAHPHTDTHMLSHRYNWLRVSLNESQAKAAATGERVVPHSSRVSWALDVLVSGCLWCSVRSKWSSK